MKDIHKENIAASEDTTVTESAEFSTASLPSRKEIHGKKKQKTKWKIKFPFVKLLALFFVILLGTVWAIFSQLTKDSETAASNNQKESGYTETIGEISGFDDEEEAEKEPEKEEKKADSNQKAEENEESTKEESASNKQQEQETEEKEENKEAEEAEVTTTETTVKEQQNTQQTTTSEQNNKGVVEHVVKSNENLFRIALKYYSSAEGVEIIKQYNGLKGNDIVVGQVLKIPPR